MPEKYWKEPSEIWLDVPYRPFKDDVVKEVYGIMLFERNFDTILMNRQYGIIGKIPPNVGVRMIVEAAEARLVIDRWNDYPGDWPKGHPVRASVAFWIQVGRDSDSFWRKIVVPKE